jgi:hypothetical protein
MATTETRRFEGIRVVVTTKTPFDQILARLAELVGQTPVDQLPDIVRTAKNSEEFAEEVQRRFIGKSDFMKFIEVNHGGYLRFYGIHRRTVRWVLGNPLIAQTMIRHDISAGLFAPVEMLITEAEDGEGASLTYVLPSSAMVIDDNPPLQSAAKDLDEKFAALVEQVTA